MGIRRQEEQKRSRNKRRKTFAEVVAKVLFWFVFLGFWVLAAWTIVFSSAMRVSAIELEDSGATAGEIEKLIKEGMEGKYLNLFPKDNLLTLSKGEISDQIKERFKLVREVSVTKVFPDRIKVTVERREKFIVWCSAERCLLVDERAEAFAEVEGSELSGKKSGVLVTDRSGKEIALGARVADSSVVEFCENLPKTVKEEGGVKVQTQSISMPSSMSEEVRVKTEQGWEIYFSTNRPLKTQAKILKKVIDEKVTLEKIANLEYIDLRIKGKVTFRFKNYKEELEEEREDALRDVDKVEGILEDNKKRDDKKKR